MSYNGSGTFVINTAGQPVVSGTVISSTAFNALTADLATGLSTAITKDGQTTPTANIPMGNNKITGLAVGTAATDAANLSQVQSTAAKLVGSVSGVDTITGTMSPTLAAYAAGQMFYFVAAGDNTGAVTLNLDGLGAKSVTRDGSVALAAGDIKSGEVVVVVYDGTRFQVVSQLNSAGNATFANVSITSALNVGGVATFSAGTAAAPSITTSGDTNNGIFFPATDVTAITTAGSERLRVDASGNLGLGVTPSATGNLFRALQVGYGTSLSGGNGLYGSLMRLGANFYNDNTNYKYIYSDFSSLYEQVSGTHKWFTAASGTAGNTITFTQAMTLDASGNLGVGTTSPTSGFRLDLQATTALQRIESTTGTNTVQQRFVNTGGTLFVGLDNSAGSSFASAYAGVLWHGGNYPLIFATNNTERARISAGGSLLLGTTSASDFRMSSAGHVTFINTDYATDGASDAKRAGVGWASTANGQTVLSSLITSENDGSYGAAIKFFTRGAGGGNFVTRATIASSGFSAAGTTHGFSSSSGDCLVGITAQNASGANPVLEFTCPGSNAGNIKYARNNDRFEVIAGGSGGVYLNQAGTSWQSLSDERQKTDLQPIEDAANKVSQLRAVTGRYVWDDESKSRAFLIAQDVQAVLPQAVDVAKEDGTLGLSYTDVIPLLVAAIKEQQAMINELKAEMAALKGA